MIRTLMFVLLGCAVSAGAWAQTPPSGVGPSVSSPTSPTGKTPPGTPTTATPAGSMARDTTGQNVIGHTATPPSSVPGNTGGAGTGAK